MLHLNEIFMKASFCRFTPKKVVSLVIFCRLMSLFANETYVAHAGTAQAVTPQMCIFYRIKKTQALSHKTQQGISLRADL